MHVYDEDDGVEVEARFKDTRDRASVPVSVHWRLDCLTSHTALVDWTEVTPTVTTDAETGTVTEVVALIEIPGSANAIQNLSNPRETKRLRVVAGKNGARQYSRRFVYQVRRDTEID